MQTFSAEQIEGTRRSFLDSGYSEVPAKIGGLDFTYFVLPQQLNTELPDFAFRMTGNGEIYGVCESIRDELRPYVAFHEVYEFRELGGEPGSCANAMTAELAQVPENLRDEHVRMRTGFFKNLIRYREVNSLPTDEFYPSLKILEDWDVKS